MHIRFTTKLLATSLMALSLGLTGCLTDSKDDKDPDPDPTPELVTTKTLTAGAQNNATHGSAIDLDLFTSYTIEPAKAIAASIDLIFAYTTAGGLNSGAIYSPDSAKIGIGGSTGFNFLSDFSPARGTEIKSVTVSNFASITTKAQVDSLWAAGTAVTNGRLLLDAGTTFLAKSNLDLVVLVKVDSLVESASGTAWLSGSAKFAAP